MVMHRFQEQAKSKGFELPSIFTDVDPNNGMPTILNASTSEDAEKCVKKASEERQKQQLLVSIIKPIQLVDFAVQVKQP